ncbi:unnamed protein product [Cuscuta epithymum]|uniref:RNase H type-1 domain-containing protein n=1 Tax=Cuscuta epithymum TaxID=186058 RepID=A0AAV0GFU0_9ASTE|nr:unnamed protein product [Cuscuta epithymum]
MWEFQLPPKIKMFFWQVCSGCLPSRLNLQVRRVDCSGSCGLCGEAPELLDHLFRRCTFAKEAWTELQWQWRSMEDGSFVDQVCEEFREKKKEDLEQLVWGCWALWSERNQRVWQGTTSSARQIVHRTRVLVEGWRQAQMQVARGRRAHPVQQGRATWSRSLQGAWKLNVDAGTRANSCGLGWCLRDTEGQFVAGVSKPWPGRLSSLGAELVGIREALSWLKDFGDIAVEVESDSVGVISEILNGSSCSLVGLLRDDIGDLARFFSTISFSHIRRLANKPAHLLSKAACSMPDSQSWFDFTPSFLVSALANDLINDN